MCRLTYRECQIVLLIAGGRTTKQIAIDLNISPRTVEVHRARMMSKFKTRKATDLIRRLMLLPCPLLTGGTADRAACNFNLRKNQNEQGKPDWSWSPYPTR